MSNYFQVLKRIEKDRADKVAVTPAADVAPAPVVSPRDPPAGRDVLDARPVPDAHVAPARPLRALPSVAPTSEHPGETAPSAPREVSARTVPPLQSVTTLQSMAALPGTRSVTLPAVEPTVHGETRSMRPRSSAPLSAESQHGIATLLDKIRALGGSQATHTLVFAGAAASDSVHAVSDGLARHAERYGMHVLVAELTMREGGHKLVALGAVPHDDERVRAIDLHGVGAPAELTSWVDRVAGTRDLVILEGPPLAESIDAALLARACDGLVIVANAEVTPRAALQAAAERAQISGCRTLGVVMSGTKEHLPSWMRRLMGTRSN
jgi:hypothetical protein